MTALLSSPSSGKRVSIQLSSGDCDSSLNFLHRPLGRKRIMMCGCILAAVSYLPIYKAMQAAAGSNIATAVSQKNAVTGAISLTPMTSVNGTLQPAKEVLTYVDFRHLASNPVAWKLILLIFIQVLFVTMVYGPIAAYLV